MDMPGQVIVTISYPPEGAGVTGGEAFPAFGYVSPPVGVQLSARIEYEASDGSIKCLHGTAVGSPPFPFDWTFLFTPVPIAPVKLIVEAADGYGNMGRAVGHFARRPLGRIPDMAQPPNVQIAFGCGGNQPPFYTGGYCTSALPIISTTATLTDAAGNTFNGTPIDPAPFDYDWYFQFTAVPPGDYTLTVTCTDSQQQSGSASCAASVAIPSSNGNGAEDTLERHR
jgi:hypothetical protein